MPMAVRWSAMWPIFLSLVRPDRISSPITMSAALTMLSPAPADSWFMAKFRRRCFTIEPEHKVGVGGRERYVAQLPKQAQQVLFPYRTVIFNDKEARPQGVWCPRKIGNEDAILGAFHVEFDGIDPCQPVFADQTCQAAALDLDCTRRQVRPAAGKHRRTADVSFVDEQAHASIVVR